MLIGETIGETYTTPFCNPKTSIPHSTRGPLFNVSLLKNQSKGIFIDMNKVSSKKDILTAHILTTGIDPNQYPVDVLKLNFELSKNTSWIPQMGKKEIEGLVNSLLQIVRENILKKKLYFGMVTFEIEQGVENGEHIYTIKLLIVGQKLDSIKRPILLDILKEIIEPLGGEVQVKFSQMDSVSLVVEIIPLQLDYFGFIQMRSKSPQDQKFYTKDLLNTLEEDLIVLSEEDIKDPLYKFELK
jgi:hypothetical protein